MQAMWLEVEARQEYQGQQGSLNLEVTWCTCVMSLCNVCTLSVHCLYNAGIVVGGRGKAGGSGSKRQLECEEGAGGSLPEQQGKGNKRCRLGPTEQLRVVVRQILAGVSPLQGLHT